MRQGENDAEDFAVAHNRKMVTITGFPVRRGGWTTYELASPDDIQTDNNAGPALAQALATKDSTESLGAVTLRGEVADSN